MEQTNQQARKAEPGNRGWSATLSKTGFLFVHSQDMRQAVDTGAMQAWPAFAQSWNDLGSDNYMADGGRYRKRRHAAFQIVSETVLRKPHQPHYQSRDYNALNGGIARWFDPVQPEVAEGLMFQSVVRLCSRLFDGLTPSPAWHIEAHQFRIEAMPGQAGQPTPEGMHQDGVDWVLVLMVGRQNIASGTTTIYGLDRTPLSSFTLEQPMDAALINDHRVFHGVTPVEPLDPALPAFRDVLVLTFRQENSAEAVAGIAPTNDA